MGDIVDRLREAHDKLILRPEVRDLLLAAINEIIELRIENEDIEAELDVASRDNEIEVNDRDARQRQRECEARDEHFSWGDSDVEPITDGDKQ